MEITLNDRELKLLKAYMGHHGWSDLLVTYPNRDNLCNKDSSSVKLYGGLRPKFRMTANEIETFRKKVDV
tara:strand:- start:289 stop:498 length:210 start_codon:yes stop_codon:yes gene_type:complete